MFRKLLLLTLPSFKMSCFRLPFLTAKRQNSPAIVLEHDCQYVVAGLGVVVFYTQTAWPRQIANNTV